MYISRPATYIARPAIKIWCKDTENFRKTLHLLQLFASYSIKHQGAGHFYVRHFKNYHCLCNKRSLILVSTNRRTNATDEDGEKVKIYQNQQGKHTTVIIFAEEDGEASLVVIDGKLDMAQLMEQMNQEN